MTPQIKTFPATRFIGKNLKFTYADYRAFELWSGFMPRRREIQNAIGAELYSIQVNPVGFSFGPNEYFSKWAAVAVTTFEFIPDGMETLEIQEGLYAVFHYKGNQSGAAAFFNMIFSEWLPNSGYKPDDRPHFEILGEKYKNGDPDSEEDIWIPIKKR